MMFVTLMVVEPEMNREVYRTLESLEAPSGIEIVSSYGLFGRYDAIIIFEAANENVAMDFVLDTCKIPGISDTETFAAKSLGR